MEEKYFDFSLWLANNENYSKRTISNIISRLKRANNILAWQDEPLYIYRLEQCSKFNNLSIAVKSQIRKSVKLYSKYMKSSTIKKSFSGHVKKGAVKITSLFSNIGVAEAYLNNIGFDVVVANELIARRASLYSKIYPRVKMVCGDITQKDVFSKIVTLSKEAKVDVLMATPPCQGMSTAGKQKKDDERNSLICSVVKAVEEIKPNYVFIENVPMFFNTYILIDNKRVLIPDYISKKLSSFYHIERYIINTQNYSVPQMRERAIMLLTKRGKRTWTLPDKDKKIITMKDAIGKLPMLDPYVTDISEEERSVLFPHFEERKKIARQISPWHKPPEHILRQVIAMQHTPTGCTAFDNLIYVPKKENGEPVKGYHNTYKRQNWDTPAYTVTMDNRKISSQNNVHPGRPEYINDKGEQIYSDSRVLTLYEIMMIMSLPPNWNIPSNTSEAFLRRIIGEGIPPLFVKKVFQKLLEVMYND